MEFTGSKGDSSISAVDFKVLQLLIYTKKVPNLNRQNMTRKSADRFFSRKNIPWYIEKIFNSLVKKYMIPWKKKYSLVEKLFDSLVEKIFLDRKNFLLREMHTNKDRYL